MSIKQVISNRKLIWSMRAGHQPWTLEQIDAMAEHCACVHIGSPPGGITVYELSPNKALLLKHEEDGIKGLMVPIGVEETGWVFDETDTRGEFRVTVGFGTEQLWRGETMGFAKTIFVRDEGQDDSFVFSVVASAAAAALGVPLGPVAAPADFEEWIETVIREADGFGPRWAARPVAKAMAEAIIDGEG